jgi:hypothetical protein
VQSKLRLKPERKIIPVLSFLDLTALLGFVGWEED